MVLLRFLLRTGQAAGRPFAGLLGLREFTRFHAPLPQRLFDLASVGALGLGRPSTTRFAKAGFFILSVLLLLALVAVPLLTLEPPRVAGNPLYVGIGALAWTSASEVVGWKQRVSRYQRDEDANDAFPWAYFLGLLAVEGALFLLMRFTPLILARAPTIGEPHVRGTLYGITVIATADVVNALITVFICGARGWPLRASGVASEVLDT